MAGWNAFLLWPTNTKKVRNLRNPVLIVLGFHAYVSYGIKSCSDPWLRVLSSVAQNSTPPRFVNSQLIAFSKFLILLRLKVYFLTCMAPQARLSLSANRLFTVSWAFMFVVDLPV